MGHAVSLAPVAEAVIYSHAIRPDPLGEFGSHLDLAHMGFHVYVISVADAELFAGGTVDESHVLRPELGENRVVLRLGHALPRLAVYQ